jgi:hypothetical protein
MDPVTYQQKKKVATDLVRFLQRKWLPDTIWDASALPLPKENIIAECLSFLESTRNAHTRAMVAAYLLRLSFYQPNVGEEPLRNCRFELFPVDITSLDADALARLKAAVSEQLPHLESDRFIDLLRKVQADFKRIEASCQAIETAREATETTASLAGDVLSVSTPAEPQKL